MMLFYTHHLQGFWVILNLLPWYYINYLMILSCSIAYFSFCPWSLISNNGTIINQKIMQRDVLLFYPLRSLWNECLSYHYGHYNKVLFLSAILYFNNLHEMLSFRSWLRGISMPSYVHMPREDRFFLMFPFNQSSHHIDDQLLAYIVIIYTLFNFLLLIIVPPRSL